MVRYLFYTIGDLTYQSPLVNRALAFATIHEEPHPLPDYCGIGDIRSVDCRTVPRRFSTISSSNRCVRIRPCHARPTATRLMLAA